MAMVSETIIVCVGDSVTVQSDEGDWGSGLTNLPTCYQKMKKFIMSTDQLDILDKMLIWAGACQSGSNEQNWEPDLEITARIRSEATTTKPS